MSSYGKRREKAVFVVRRQWAESAVDDAALRVQSRQHQPLGAGLRRLRSSGIGAWEPATQANAPAPDTIAS